MRVSYTWLNELVEIDGISPSELADRLTNVGLAVDAVEPRNKGVRGVVVGEVVSCLQHPQAERLHVCEVNVGSGELLTIVCGAPNVAKGQRVPTALPGSVLPGGPIAKATLRGIESNGMLCSADEIGLETRLLPKSQTEGLYVLPADAPIGEDVVKLLHLDDVVLEVDLTPNRSDCLSMRGMAFEVSAVFRRALRDPQLFAVPHVDLQPENEEFPITIRLETQGCSRYEAQVLDGAQPTESPLWLQMRLVSMGVRPINRIVDVTNLVMLEWGQPLHAFDFAQVHQQTIVVRQGNAAEEVVTLDGETRRLTEDTIVIADEDRSIGIAGVMGGENSEISDVTTRIVLESAVFDAASVRRTGQRLGLRSEAQQRFEKGIDPAAVRGALLRAATLLEQVSGATRVAGVVSVRNNDLATMQTISFSPERCNQLLGTEIHADVMWDIFTRLGFHVTEMTVTEWNVQVPTRRPDLGMEADLVEEIGRLYGLDSIPSTLPHGPTTVGVRNAGQKLRKRTRDVLLGTGMTEVFTYTLTHPSLLDALRMPPDSPGRMMIPLLRPMSEERTVLRTHMLPGLAQVANYNLTHGVQGGQVFEIGRVYLPHSIPITTQPEEPTRWAGLWFGLSDPGFGERARKFDFFDVKGTIEVWFHALGLGDQVTFSRAREQPWLHPGRSAVVSLGDLVIGYFGELHPETGSALEIGTAMYADFDLDALIDVSTDRWRVASLPKYPGSRRDLAVVVEQGIPVASLLDAARRTSSTNTEDILEKCWVFDVYTGTGIAEHHKSVAVALTYRSDARTLTDSEISELETQILTTWKTELGAQLRAM